MSQTVVIKIGNHLSNQVAKLDSSNNDTCRTQRQLESFISWIHATPDVVFLINNPFYKDTENESYKSTFHIRYYDKRNLLCGATITPTGIIKNKCQGDALKVILNSIYCDMTKYGMINKTIGEELAEIQLTIDSNKVLGITNYPQD